MFSIELRCSEQNNRLWCQQHWTKVSLQRTIWSFCLWHLDIRLKFIILTMDTNMNFPIELRYQFRDIIFPIKKIGFPLSWGTKKKLVIDVNSSGPKCLSQELVLSFRPWHLDITLKVNMLEIFPHYPWAFWYMLLWRIGGDGPSARAWDGCRLHHVRLLEGA